MINDALRKFQTRRKAKRMSLIGDAVDAKEMVEVELGEAAVKPKESKIGDSNNQRIFNVACSFERKRKM